MAKKKLTTQEILAAARAQSGSSAEKPSEALDSEATSAEAQSSEGSASVEGSTSKPAGGGTPKSTSDILAAARAQAGQGKAAAKPAAKPAGGGAAKSTTDILAAARAQAGKGGGVEKPVAKTKPAATAKSSSAGDRPAAERPSVQEMLNAVRHGKPTEESADVAKPTALIVPKKPARIAKPVAVPTVPRRSALAVIVLWPFAIFGNPFAAAWTLFTAATGVFTLALARFMMPNVLVEPPSKFKIGPADDYPAGTVSTKWKSEFGVWIVNTVYQGQPQVYALSTVCTHLGCTPNWLDGEQKFKCPCHGSGFRINGVNFEGPAPRPLERYGIRVAEDGMVEVDKSMKFQQELGQWSDPASFLPVA